MEQATGYLKNGRLFAGEEATACGAELRWDSDTKKPQEVNFCGFLGEPHYLRKPRAWISSR